MSFAYTTAPPTKGKLVIHTTKGPLEIELWAKETPRTCRNFLQLCMEGYYDHTSFHRLVRGFILQGGDPSGISFGISHLSGTGTGGESIYNGRPFEDEFHSRLRFTHRGILAMANTGFNTNMSQFFFTLDRADELNHRNTIFGKVVGDTIYNLVGMGELETDDKERPLNPPVITKIEILANPFDDIVPRTSAKELAFLEEQQRLQQTQKEIQKKPKPKKNLALLSFGEEAKEEEITLRSSETQKIKSSHDLLQNDPRLSKEQSRWESSESDSDSEKEKTVARKRAPPSDSDEERVSTKKPKETTPVVMPSQERMTTLKDQVQKMKQELRSMAKPDDSATRSRKPAPVSFLDQMKTQYLKSGKVTKARAPKKQDVLSQMASFKSLIKKSGTVKQKSAVTNEERECDLHFVKGCKSCKDTFGQDDEGDDRDWLKAELKFAKDVGANVYEPKVDDYTIEDPRAAIKKADPFGRDAPSGKREWKDRAIPRRSEK